MHHALIIPVYKNESFIPELISVVEKNAEKVEGLFDAVFVDKLQM